VVATIALLATPDAVGAHVVIEPAQSPAGATLHYTIVVPGEKHADMVKVEVQFPRPLVVLQLMAPVGWQVTPQKDGTERIVGAVWEGGAVPFDQFVKLGVLARNPRSTTDLSWSVIQMYADGSEVQWLGPETAQFPATITRVRGNAFDMPAAAALAGAALIVSIVALALALRVRRTRRSA
jgi:uncharacterized protein YcnI